MGVVIGEFLTCIRAEMEISQKELCEGAVKYLPTAIMREIKECRIFLP